MSEKQITISLCRLSKTDFEPRLLKIGGKWVFLENTSLPQKASETTADDAETSQIMFSNVQKQEFALIPIVGSQILAREILDEQCIQIYVFIPTDCLIGNLTPLNNNEWRQHKTRGVNKWVGPNSGPHPLHT